MSLQLTDGLDFCAAEKIYNCASLYHVLETT
jgi:hypothetical protein